MIISVVYSSFNEVSAPNTKFKVELMFKQFILPIGLGSLMNYLYTYLPIWVVEIPILTSLVSIELFVCFRNFAWLDICLPTLLLKQPKVLPPAQVGHLLCMV